VKGRCSVFFEVADVGEVNTGVWSEMEKRRKIKRE
jgi:hypothetical protein